MNRAVFAGVILWLGVVSFALATDHTITTFQQATILSVNEQEVDSPPNNGGRKVTDAPLHSSFFEYRVSVQTTCGTYTGRYQTPYEYLPSGIKANQQVPVRITKHDLYFDLPGESEFKMPITSRKLTSKTDCGSVSKL